MSMPFGGSIPEEIVLNLEQATVVLFALDEAIEVAGETALRSRLKLAARIIVEKLLPDLPDL